MKKTLLVIYFFFTLVLFSCSQPQWKELRGGAWNTVYTIKYFSEGDFRDSIIQIINDIDLTFSPFNPSSTVSAINNNQPVEVTEDFIELFSLARDINAKSSGYFDVTVEPLLVLWGFGSGSNKDSAVPTENEIKDAMAKVGLQHCLIENGQVIKKSSSTKLNFSAIAKGYGCDKIGDMFRRNGVEDFMIEIGGEICLHGQSPRNKDWIIQIDAPDNLADGEGVLNLQATDCGIATSGNYRNFRQLQNGDTIGHTVSPLTGHPFKSDIFSVTIVAESTALADGFATACMAMPPAEAVAMIDKEPDVSALFVVEKSLATIFRDAPKWEIIEQNERYAVVATRNFLNYIYK